MVVIAAPHTSNWDLPFMLAFAWTCQLKVRWLGKHTLFKPPWGPFMRFLGGIAIDRRAPRGTVGQLVDQFGDDQPLVLAVPPEGTRKGGDFWKSGFYHIARGLEVPIAMSYLDYGRKRGGFGPLVHPSDDLKADMDRIRAFYTGITPARPELFRVPRLREEGEEDAERGGA